MVTKVLIFYNLDIFFFFFCIFTVFDGNLVNMLLTELDGLNVNNSNLFVIGSVIR